MTACFQSLLLLPLLVQVYGGTLPPQEGEYKNSLLLTRMARTRVSQLLRTYKEQQLGDKHFEDRSLHLNDLPTLSTDLHSWLSLEDRERLSQASLSLHTYWSMLQWKREQILAEESHQGASQGGRLALSLPDSLLYVQLDLRDLITRLQTLVESVGEGKVTHSASPPPLQHHGNQTPWMRRLDVYVVLRDLDLYLTKTGRDLLLLGARHHR
ncbi:hypothetical protein NHX12_010294 [Muraenolepis orangiensis]|uniref:Uncharacterized protein n=1 Tax=Muraenolepis orangiensis TaxID=630683 RepID=A0A9Q0I8A6_9TELE|nr:hypothetical protein NHX12_010294 [Muraenolepis orangiensis]